MEDISKVKLKNHLNIKQHICQYHYLDIKGAVVMQIGIGLVDSTDMALVLRSKGDE